MSEVVKEEVKIERRVGNLIDESRILNFSDAVFAFAATLLVLKIDLPTLSPNFVQEDIIASLYSLWPQYLANIISFLIIGYYWLTHHAIFGMIKRYNLTIVWLNIIFLVLLSFLPFPVDLYGEYMQVPVIVVFYCASLAVVGSVLGIMWLYASYKKQLISKETSRRHTYYYTARIFLAPVVFTLSIPLVYLDPLITQVFWIFVLVGIVIINKVFKFRGVSKIEKLTV